MHILIGQMTLWLALVLAGLSLACAIAASIRRDLLSAATARDALLGCIAMTLASTGTLLSAFIRNDFTLEYVAANSDLRLPLIYRISALWRGATGSLLLWAALLAICALAYLLIHRRKMLRQQALVIAGVALQLFMLLALLMTTASPFAPLDRPPVDGAGMRLMLQVWAMVIHPPVTFVAYAAFGVAGAISIACLATGRLRDNLPALRGFLLAGWLTMTVGIVLGGYWAYTDLGWEGYWSWDAVENASLIPWLVATAALHTLRLAPAQRLLRTTHVLSIFSLLTCILATFIARGGVPAQSRHTYAPGALTNVYLIFMILALVLMVILLIRNRRRRPSGQPRPAMTQASATIVLTTGIIVLFAAVVLIGTVGPGLPVWLQQNLQHIDSGAGRWLIDNLGLRTFVNSGGQLIAPVEQSRFDRLAAVFGMTVLAALGVCPWLMRRSGNSRTRVFISNAIILALIGVVGVSAGIGPLWVGALVALGLWIVVGQLVRLLRSGRLSWPRLPATVAHLGLVMLFAAVAVSENLVRESSFTVRPGEEAQLADLTIRYDKADRQLVRDGQHLLVSAKLTVLRNDQPVARLSPAIRQNTATGDQRRDAGLQIGAGADIMASLESIAQDDQAQIIVRRRPGVLWIWVGSALLAVGSLLGLLMPWPRKGRPCDGSATGLEPEAKE